MDGKPNALAHWGEIAAELEGRRPAVFLDFDGTLAPIASRPDLAQLSHDMRETLRRLAAVVPTTIVSGRGRDDVTRLVGLDDVIYAGSHGFDIAGPAIATPAFVARPGVEPTIAQTAEELRERTADIPGVVVEDKKFSIAVHYRLVADERVPDVEGSVDDALARRPELTKAYGKKVFELRPAIEWNKGRAMLWLLEKLGLDRPDVVPLFIGDDVTDEDAFVALQTRGIAIIVADLPCTTAARYSLHDVGEVRELLERLAERAGKSPS